MSIESFGCDLTQAQIASLASGDTNNEEIGQALTGLSGVFLARFLKLRMQRADAEDLVSETLRRIIKHGKTFRDRGEGSFRAWSRKIADNVFLTWQANRKRGGTTLSDSEMLSAIVAPPVEDDDEATEPEQTTLKYVIREAFGFLPERDRELLTWRAINEEPSADIAQRLGTSDAAVRQSFKRAKAKLKDRLMASWPQINDWRVSLILKKHDPSLSDSLIDSERQEITCLQEIASVIQHLVDPLPLG